MATVRSFISESWAMSWYSKANRFLRLVDPCVELEQLSLQILFIVAADVEGWHELIDGIDALFLFAFCLLLQILLGFAQNQDLQLLLLFSGEFESSLLLLLGRHLFKELSGSNPKKN